MRTLTNQLVALLVVAFAILPLTASAAGRLQDADFKSLAELQAAGGSAAQLLNDTKIYVSSNGISDTLSNAITQGALGGAGGGSSGLEALLNPGFEKVLSQGWVSSGGTFSRVTYTNPLPGNKYYATFQATAAGQYVRSTAQNITPNLANQSCLARVPLTAVDANYKVQVVDGTGTVLAINGTNAELVTKAGTVTVPYEIGFRCPSAGSISVQLISTAAGGLVSFDDLHLGSEDRFYRVNGITQDSIGVQGYLGAASGYSLFKTLTSSNNGLLAYATTGGYSRLTALKKVNAVITFGGSNGTVASGTVWIKVFNSSNVLVNGSYGSAVNGNAYGFTSSWTGVMNPGDYAVLQTNAGWSDDLGTQFSITATYLDPANLYLQTQAPNPLDFVNDFSAKFANANLTLAVQSQNQPWVASYTYPGAGRYAVVFNTGVFTVAPACTCAVNTDASNGDNSCNVYNVTATGATVHTSNGNAATGTSDFTLACHKQTPDYKLRTTILGSLANTIYSGVSNTRSEFFSFGGSDGTNTNRTNCTSTCSVYQTSVPGTTVVRNGAGDYTITFPTGSFSAPPTCFGASLSLGVSTSGISPFSGTPAINSYRMTCWRPNPNVATDCIVDLQCSGFR